MKSKNESPSNLTLTIPTRESTFACSNQHKSTSKLESTKTIDLDLIKSEYSLAYHLKPEFNMKLNKTPPDWLTYRLKKYNSSKSIQSLKCPKTNTKHQNDTSTSNRKNIKNTKSQNYISKSDFNCDDHIKSKRKFTCEVKNWKSDLLDSSKSKINEKIHVNDMCSNRYNYKVKESCSIFFSDGLNGQHIRDDDVRLPKTFEKLNSSKGYSQHIFELKCNKWEEQNLLLLKNDSVKRQAYMQIKNDGYTSKMKELDKKAFLNNQITKQIVTDNNINKAINQTINHNHLANDIGSKMTEIMSINSDLKEIKRSDHKEEIQELQKQIVSVFIPKNILKPTNKIKIVEFMENDEFKNF